MMKLKISKTPVASLVKVHQKRAKAGLGGPASVKCHLVKYHVYLWHDSSVCYHFKTRLDSEPLQQPL